LSGRGRRGRRLVIDQLRERARKCIADTGEPIDDETFHRFAARLSYLSGDFADDSIYDQVARTLNGARNPVFDLEIPPRSSGWSSKGSPAWA